MQPDQLDRIEAMLLKIARHVVREPADRATSWSRERLTVGERWYRQGGSDLRQAVAEINALPGPQVTVRALQRAAHRHGWRRPRVPVAAPAVKTVRVDYSYAMAWAAPRGLLTNGVMVLSVVNAKRRAIGLPMFEIQGVR